MSKMYKCMYFKLASTSLIDAIAMLYRLEYVLHLMTHFEFMVQDMLKVSMEKSDVMQLYL